MMKEFKKQKLLFSFASIDFDNRMIELKDQDQPYKIKKNGIFEREIFILSFHFITQIYS